MTKLAAVIGVLVLAPAVFGQTQERPNYSGIWTLVEDGTKPTGRPLLGNRFKLSQSPTTVTIETTITVLSGSRPPGGGAIVSESNEIPLPIEYTCDGAEHDEVLPSSVPGVGVPPLGAVGSSPPPTTYRATWMNGQLIILKHTKSRNENNAIIGVTRLALSLEADGSLVVDALLIAMRPKPNGPKQEPPVSVRSVYKKAQ
jgi:hypothetical protein